MIIFSSLLIYLLYLFSYLGSPGFNSLFVLPEFLSPIRTFCLLTSSLCFITYPYLSSLLSSFLFHLISPFLPAVTFLSLPVFTSLTSSLPILSLPYLFLPSPYLCYPSLPYLFLPFLPSLFPLLSYLSLPLFFPRLTCVLITPSLPGLSPITCC